MSQSVSQTGPVPMANRLMLKHIRLLFGAVSSAPNSGIKLAAGIQTDCSKLLAAIRESLLIQTDQSLLFTHVFHYNITIMEAIF